MRKQIALLVRVIALVVVAFANPAQAKTVLAASCSRADVGTAVTAAAAGDTVTAPAGTCTWTSSLRIVKGITLRGAGSSQTIIQSGGVNGYLLVYNPDANSVSTNARFEVSGFTFDLMNINDEGGLWLNNTSATPISQISIHDNVFRNQANSGSSLDRACLAIGENGDAYGVAYSNTFRDCKIVGENYGNYQTSWNNTTFKYGSANNFYWEDNTLTGNSVFHYGGHGGRYVSRFNTYTFANGAFQVVWDVHGNQPSGVYGTMGCEIYNNTVSLARSTTVVDHRGGSCMIFKNNTSGTAGLWQIREEFDDSISPTINSQPQRVSNSYYFLNTFNGSNQGLSESQDCCNAIAANREYWNYTTSFNGTEGVGSGLLLARPSTCTTGVGYWATDQGEWDSTHAGADGQFYKCTATNTWTLYYTPLTYPHPLRTGTSVAPPTNLTLTVQ